MLMSHDRRVPKLVLVCGLPGVGKTTHSTALEQRLPAVRLCADDWLEALGDDLWDERARERVEQLQWQLAQRLLAVGTSTVIEWGTWSRAERDDIRDAASRLAAYTELHYLDAPIDVIHQRIDARGREQPAINREQLEQWAASFEIPTDDETRHWDRFINLNTT
jgi:predicted kinase